jgi:hypothetical protein
MRHASQVASTPLTPIECHKLLLTQLEQRQSFTKYHNFSGTAHLAGGFGIPASL